MSLESMEQVIVPYAPKSQSGRDYLCLRRPSGGACGWLLIAFATARLLCQNTTTATARRFCYLGIASQLPLWAAKAYM